MAQSVELRTSNRKVVSSNPPRIAQLFRCVLEHGTLSPLLLSTQVLFGDLVR